MEEGTGLGEWQGLHIGKGGSVGRTEEGRDGLVVFVVFMCVCVFRRGGGGSRSVRREMRRWWFV